MSDVNDLSSVFLVLSAASGGPDEGRKRRPASIFSLLLDVFPDLQGSLSRGETSEGYYPVIWLSQQRNLIEILKSYAKFGVS